MNVYFTIQVETDKKSNFVSLPLLVFASDEDEAMSMSQSIVECLGLLNDKSQAAHHNDTREELEMLNNDVYFLNSGDIQFVTKFLAQQTERFKQELADKKSAGLCVVISDDNFTEEAIKHFHSIMGTHRAIRKIDRELSDA